MKGTDFFIWRHAEAEDTSPDMTRRLTSHGRRDAAKVAKALAPHLRDGLVVSSPATRARETAEPLVEPSGLRLEIEERLSPGAPIVQVVAALDAAIAGIADRPVPLVFVGHQPWVGQLAHRLLVDADGDLGFRKAAAWWFVRKDRGGHAEWSLRTVFDPDLS